MNNYFELKYLANELNRKLRGALFEFSITPHKNVWEGFFTYNHERQRLVCSVQPEETALFLDRYRPAKKSNAVRFFESLEGDSVSEVSIAHLDRLIYVDFDSGAQLLFKLFSNRPNVMLVQNGIIKETFKNPDDLEGEQPPQPQQPKFAEEVPSNAKPRNQLTRLNPLLPRELLPDLIKQHHVDEMNDGQVADFVERITDELKHPRVFRVLQSGEVCLWTEQTLNVPTDEQFDSLNDAIRHAYRNKVHERRLSRRKASMIEKLEEVIQKWEAELKQLEQADKALERADTYERYGHLLMAAGNREIKDGQDHIEVADFYNNNEPLSIPVKPSISVVQNAERYYDKASDAKTSYEQSKKRKKSLKKRLSKLRGIKESLETIEHVPELEKWEKEHAALLSQWGVLGQSSDEDVSRPYRKFKTNNYEIWVGKNAKSNDQLTSTAHKEDIWLHARGVGGSHVVIRMGNNKDYPPQEVILQAAGLAAWYSKSRGNKTAPVMYTKRKYVRKPKGAPPGAVVVEREEVVMVPPINPGKANVKPINQL